jgi:M6 family metalloprotease-like protein
MKRLILVSSLLGITILLSSCMNITQNGSPSSTGASADAFVIPDPPENSNHGFLTEDTRIPTLNSCEEWLEFFGLRGPAVSFAVSGLFSNEQFEVSTQLYLKNKHLDKNGDGVICFLEEGDFDGNASALSETEISTITVLADASECRIQHSGFVNSTNRAGFPQHPDYVTPDDGKVVIQLIYVDAEDLRGTEKPSADASFWIDGAGGFLKDVTDGKIDFDWRFEDEYFPLPKPLKDYNVTREKQGDPQVFVQAAITASDSKIDFSDVDIVIAVPPPTVTNQQIDFSPAIPLRARTAFRTQEGSVYRGTLAGIDTRWPSGYLLIAHEIGHLLGLQDYYSLELLPDEDPFAGQFKFMGEFDNMNYAPGKAREWTAWSRWLIGTLEDDQIRCLVDGQETTHQITAISSDSKEPKAVVIPTGKFTAIVIESRKSMRHDFQLPVRMQGLLVYEVDTRRDSGSGPLRIVKKDGIQDQFMLDAPLRVGESVTIDGFTIENVESGRFWDVAKVTSNK